MNNIIEVNPEKAKSTIEAIQKGGVNKLHILSDFDQTLTKVFVQGKKTPSLISILRDENYLTSDYPEKAKALYRKYHAIEIDPAVPLGEKKKAMEEWWTRHFDLLIASGLTRQDIKRAMLSSRVELRKGAGEFLDLLNQHQIPLIILSSSGLGSDSISIFLQKEKKMYDNTHIISNSYVWNNEGQAIAIGQPIIHTLNKDETVIRDFPSYPIIRDRKNVILLGDSEGDVGMITGFDYDNLLKICFLNEKIEERLERFKTIYDVIVINDSTFEYLNRLLHEILTS